MSRDTIEQVMNAHAGDLMAIAGVVGVAVGMTGNRTPCIMVLVAELTDEVRENIPSLLEGYPVTIEETGTIRGMPGGDD